MKPVAELFSVILEWFWMNFLSFRLFLIFHSLPLRLYFAEFFSLFGISEEGQKSLIHQNLAFDNVKSSTWMIEDFRLEMRQGSEGALLHHRPCRELISLSLSLSLI